MGRKSESISGTVVLEYLSSSAPPLDIPTRESGSVAKKKKKKFLITYVLRRWLGELHVLYGSETKGSQIKTIPRRGSVIRVKVIDTVHLSLNVPSG
ncbi:hypothetical protein F8M41_021134 [Gigaspora margarita]|uniref:Uncharacterized protein n=1 Tax=Gigaspora margarita TaxID=4874 RepID=A0A8H4AHB1_GIGMA|nr:hypothetical protein F8M41_021134 [Gigaspora margarita]